MPIAKETRDEIKKRLSALKYKPPEQINKEIEFLLNSIPALIADSEALAQQFHVVNVPGVERRKMLFADSREMADLFVEMCQTYGTVTWKLMQDLGHTQDPGQGVYMLSEGLPEELRTQLRMPHALARTEPDALGNV